MKTLIPVLLGLSLAAPAAGAASLCPPTRLTCFLETQPIDQEAICGRVLTRRLAIRLLTRQLRRAAEMIDGGNMFCGSLQALEATEFFALIPPPKPELHTVSVIRASRISEQAFVRDGQSWQEVRSEGKK